MFLSTVLFYFFADHETTPTFDLTLYGTDRGNPPLQAKLTIEVHVTDANDNHTIFAKPVR